MLNVPERISSAIKSKWYGDQLSKYNDTVAWFRGFSESKIKNQQKEFINNFANLHVILSQKFREINFLSKGTLLQINLTKKKELNEGKLCCVNYGNLLSRFFGKNFVKPTHLLNKLLKS